ncbi:MAG: MFS transporter [Nitrososphaerota archaeon]
MQLSDAAQESKWTSAHTWSFIAFSFGMFLEAYIYGLSFIASGWYPVSGTALQTLILIWSPLFLITGIAFAGPLSDALGRKKTFYLTMLLYAIGAVGIYFSNSYFTTLPFLALLLFAAGGEMNTIMTATHEVMPRRHRSKAMYWEVNFINAGGTVLGAVAIVASTLYNSVYFQREMIAATFLPILVILAYSRYKMPESIRWLEAKGKVDEANHIAQRYYLPENNNSKISPQGSTFKVPPLWVKVLVTTVVAASNTIGFTLMAYTIGPFFNQSLTAYYILAANLVGFIVGAAIATLADRLSRRSLLLYSSLGVVAVTWIIYYYVGLGAINLTLFWAMLILFYGFVGVNYLSEDTLKGELWHTSRRGTYTALTRFISIGLSIPVILITSSWNIPIYTLFNAIVWTCGLLAILLWRVKGVETGKGVPIGVASGEVKPM